MKKIDFMLFVQSGYPGEDIHIWTVSGGGVSVLIIRNLIIGTINLPDSGSICRSNNRVELTEMFTVIIEVRYLIPSLKIYHVNLDLFRNLLT